MRADEDEMRDGNEFVFLFIVHPSINMLGLLLLTAITTFHPARPTVGDPITIDFAAPTVVDPSPDYEVVSRGGNRVVIRTFVPHTIAVTGRGGGRAGQRHGPDPFGVEAG